MLAPQVTFRGIRHSESLESDVVRRFERLATFAPGILGGRVLVEMAGRHHRSGNRVHVRVEVDLPGEDVVVDRDATPRATIRGSGRTVMSKSDEPDPDQRFAKVAIRKAFEATRRRIQDQVRRRRGA